MGTVAGTCEIVEAKEGFSAESRMTEIVKEDCMSKQARVYSIDDDINQLFDSVSIKTSVKAEAVRRNPMKRPIRANALQTSGIGITESVNLKQALRGLCISQASEMAAMKKRSLKPAGSPGMSDVGTLSQLHKTVVVKARGPGLTINDGKRNLEISFPGKIMANLSEAMSESVELSASKSSNQSGLSSAPFATTLLTKTKVARAPSKDKIVPLPTESIGEKSSTDLVWRRNLQMIQSLHGMHTIKNRKDEQDLVATKADASSESAQLDKGRSDMSNSESCSASCGVSNKMKNTRSISPLRTYQFRKNLVKRKGKTQSDSPSSTSNAADRVVDVALLCSPTTGKQASLASEILVKHEIKITGGASAVSNTKNASSGVSSSVADAGANQLNCCKIDGGVSNVIADTNIRSRSREKGNFSQSSKSSMGEYSCSTSEESSASGSSRCCNRPHMSKDMRWECVHSVQKQYGFLSLRHFKLLRRLGSGDIGTVYLVELVGANCLFALKVMDNEFLARRNKLVRAQMEREILQMLDHPFLPTLYAHFTTDKLSCLVMEYCPGGDLHVIRQRQPSRCFSEQAARFYVAEVLLALEYLHMLGIVYRDLKPENILVREDGHIMLSDFDLSLRCVVNPTLLTSSSPIIGTAKKTSSGLCSESSCIDPFCLQPSWQVSCFTPRLLTAASKTQKLRSDPAAQVTPWPQLVAEPTDARSNSFVGTHEYLAPEIVKGEGHGSAVDWWTYGIFLYELLYGKTPFKGSSNEVTLTNVVSQPLRFPETPLVSFHAKDLIRGLLVKQPQNRLGFVKGAAEIKQHPFFEGLNWALIRCAVPPERPRFRDAGQGLSSSSRKDNNKPLGVDSSEHIEFELF